MPAGEPCSSPEATPKGNPRRGVLLGHEISLQPGRLFSATRLRTVAASVSACGKPRLRTSQLLALGTSHRSLDRRRRAGTHRCGARTRLAGPDSRPAAGYGRTSASVGYGMGLRIACSPFKRLTCFWRQRAHLPSGGFGKLPARQDQFLTKWSKTGRNRSSLVSLTLQCLTPTDTTLGCEKGRD